MAMIFLFASGLGLFLWGAVTILVLTLAVELIAAVIAQPLSVQTLGDHSSLSLVVVIPAHNEANCIGQTLATLKPQLRPQDNLLVVADNCSDATAAIAHGWGATVLERQNEQQRGKGYALAFAIDHLRGNPPDVVLFVDADCEVTPGSVSALVAQVASTQKPAQAIYLMAQPPEVSLKSAISVFAFRVKNMVRPLGLSTFGQPCLLTGTGMAFPWPAITQVTLATASIVEDMTIGLELAIAGFPPQLCPRAMVTSTLPTDAAATTTQRTRWEHGHLQVAITYTPRLIQASIRQGHLALLALALEVAIPPLSLLTIACLLVASIGLVIGALALRLWLTLGSLLPLGLLTASILITWFRYGRSDLSPQQLAQVPAYLLWKIPIYLKFLTHPQSIWIKTSR